MGTDPRRHAWHRWQCWMLLGDFDRAWQESDRSDAASFGGRGPAPSSRVLVRCLRGFGDAIQFLRFARELRKHSSELVVQGPARVLPLLRLFPGVDRTVSLEEPLTNFDFEMEASDLPYLFRTTIPELPPPPSLNRIEPGQPIQTDVLKVGIAWGAGEWNPIRAIPLSHFSLLTTIPGVRLFSLQRGKDALELDQDPKFQTIVNTEREDGSILDTAKSIAGLDLVISVDTMVAHLAGTLGRPVWMLINYAADWRWMLERSDSPWYSSMRIFRQPRQGDWNTLIREVSETLQRELAFDDTHALPFATLRTPVLPPRGN